MLSKSEAALAKGAKVPPPYGPERARDSGINVYLCSETKRCLHPQNAFSGLFYAQNAFAARALLWMSSPSGKRFQRALEFHIGSRI